MVSGRKIPMGRANKPKRTVIHNEPGVEPVLQTIGSFNSRIKLSSPTKVRGFIMPSVTFMLVKLKISEAMMGRKVKAMNPIIQGLRYVNPWRISRRALGGSPRKAFREGILIWVSCSNIRRSL